MNPVEFWFEFASTYSYLAAMRVEQVAARVACAAQEQPWMPEFARRVYTANFGEDRDISERPLFASILDSLGLDGSGLVARTAEPAGKEGLRVQTEQAWEAGVFGAPTFIFDGEIFWGNDRMEEALEWHRKRAADGSPSSC